MTRFPDMLSRECGVTILRDALSCCVTMFRMCQSSLPQVEEADQNDRVFEVFKFGNNQRMTCAYHQFRGATGMPYSLKDRVLPLEGDDRVMRIP